MGKNGYNSLSAMHSSAGAATGLASNRLDALEHAMREVAAAGRAAHARAEAAEHRAEAAEAAATDARSRAEAAEYALGEHRAGSEGDVGAAREALQEVQGLTGRVDAALRGMAARAEERTKEEGAGGNGGIGEG